MRTHFRLATLLAVTALLAACPKEEPIEEEEDGGAPPPDVCNTVGEAFTPACALTLGALREDYISVPGDQDWFGVQIPATVTPRSLLHITAGYGVPNTAVNLAVNVLRENGEQSLAQAVDSHGQGAPRPIDIIFPFGEANAKLVLLLSDEGLNPSRPNFDVRAPYQLKAEVVENPDTNEPNDTVPTAIALTPAGGISSGTGTGYLATADDVDLFQFNVPAGSQILYLHLTAPLIKPSAPFRLSYVLKDAQGNPVAEARTDNNIEAVDLATARKVAPGAYTVSVQGYRGPSQTGAIAGDLRLQYTLDVRAMPEQDTNEPNDTAATGKSVALNLGGSASISGRIGSVPDSDWYRVNLAANSAPTLLKYRLTAGSGAGRFVKLPGVVDRQLRVLTDVPGGAAVCKADKTVCPRPAEMTDDSAALVDGYCSGTDGARCLRSSREENLTFDDLRNFEGWLPIPPHAAQLTVSIVVEDAQNDWADDVDYSLSLSWSDDPDEAARFSGGVEQTTVVGMAQVAGFPVPGGGATNLSGTLSAGHGRLYQHSPIQGDGVRAPVDYDAVATDEDRYELTLPVVAAPEDRTWVLQWSVDKLPDAGVAHELALDVRFCDGSAGGTCTPVPSLSQDPFTVAYTGGNLASWHKQSAFQPVFDRAEDAQRITVTARPYGCFCLERPFMQGGKLSITVGAVDRDRYGVVPYSVKTSLVPYPQQYPGTGVEGTLSCPPPVADGGGFAGGCQFTNQ